MHHASRHLLLLTLMVTVCCASHGQALAGPGTNWAQQAAAMEAVRQAVMAGESTVVRGEYRHRHNARQHVVPHVRRSIQDQPKTPALAKDGSERITSPAVGRPFDLLDFALLRLPPPTIA